MSRKEQDSTKLYQPQLHREQQVERKINRALDRTRQNIKKRVNEAKKDISIYAEQITNLQERAIDATRDIAEDYIDSQKEIN
jgi:hemerythrin-like domain-containing protein